MEIADRRVATVHFTLTDEQGKTVTSTRGHAPLVRRERHARAPHAVE